MNTEQLPLFCFQFRKLFSFLVAILFCLNLSARDSIKDFSNTHLWNSINKTENSSCSHPDYDALIALYNSTDGANWINNTGWINGAAGTDCEPCSWYGVSCNADDRVICIDLDGVVNCTDGGVGNGNNLNGTIPPEIGDITYLETLLLRNDPISGSIPEELANLEYLEYIVFRNNNLSGSIPSQLGTISTLTHLALQFNDLTGTIPESLGDLTNLGAMYLHYNDLEGCIPNNLSNLCSNTNVQINNNANLDNDNWNDFCDNGTGQCDSDNDGCPDLTIEVTVTNITPSGVNYNYIITNIGDADADLNVPTSAGYDNVSIQNYWTNDPDPNNFPSGGAAAGGSIIGSSPLPILQPGETFSGSYGASNNLSSSYQYLALKVDWGNSIDECDENNNVVILEGGCNIINAHNYNQNADFNNDSCETCDDGIMNGDETDVDCGGALCGSCAEPPSLIEPLDGGTVDNGCSNDGRFDEQILIPFEWNSVTNATEYNIYAKIPNAQIPIVDVITSNINYTYSCNGCFTNAYSLEVKVRALVNGSWTAFSNVTTVFYEPVNTDCPEDVLGCVDPDSHNYDPEATEDDGSCETCYDGIMNGDETDVDCGGDLCEPCSTPGFDLYLTNSDLSDMTIEQGNILTIYTRQNIDDPSIDEIISDVSYYVSDDDLLDPGDTLLETDDSDLGDGDAYDNENYSFTIDASYPEGIYYVIIVADPEDDHAESDQANNTQALEFEVIITEEGDDFYVENHILDITTVAAGGIIEADCDQYYSGTSTSTLSVKLGYYLSSDNVFDSGDIYLDKDNSTLKVTDLFDPEGEDLKIPESTVPGFYYILFVADYNDVFVETDETNNVSFVEIEVTEAEANDDDFYIQNAEVSNTFPAPGTTITLSCDNSYSGNASSTQHTYMGYYLSEDNIFDADDDYIDDDFSTLSSSDESDGETDQFTIPSDTPDGLYYILFVADHEDEYVENDETNNVIAIQIEVGGVDMMQANDEISSLTEENSLPIQLENKENSTLFDLQKNKIILFPNPTSDILNIRLDRGGVYRYEVYDDQGKKWKDGIIMDKNYSININNIPSGKMVLRLTDALGNTENKLFLKIN